MRLAKGRGPHTAGACTLVFGDSDLTLTLARANVVTGDDPLTIEGELYGALVADVYEQAAAM